MEIREYDQEKDFAAVASWSTDERTHALWCAGLTAFPLEKESFMEMLLSFSKRFGDKPYVAVDENGQVEGFFCYSLNEETHEGMLKFVMVDPSRRGKGLGKQMIRQAIRFAFSDSSTKAVHLMVFAGNERAERCYAGAGFRERKMDLQPFRYKDEEWARKNMVIRREDLYEMTNTISPEDYMDMRKTVGWHTFALEEAAEGLKNCYLWCLRDNGRPIALARVIWDHGYVVYIADVIVLPEYQGQGLGRHLMETVMAFIRSQMKPGYMFMVSLMSAVGKNEFYKKFGFVDRPSEKFGPGMHQWLISEETETK